MALEPAVLLSHFALHQHTTEIGTMKKLLILSFVLITFSQTYSPLIKAENGAHVINSSPLPRI
jgi:hypothetical protein